MYGLAIYNFLKRCDAKVEVEIIGLAASIASVIAMAANKGKLRIARNAFIMIHAAEGTVEGTSEEVRQGADLIDLYTNQIVDVYSQRTGKTIDEVKALIANGDYWMTGEEAVAQGFADETFNDTPNLQIAARLDKTVYKNIPASISNQVQSSPDTAEKNTENYFTTQFNEMKKFFTEIVNAIKGVKPGEKPEDFKNITNQIADAVQVPFEKLGDEIEGTITSKVNEATGEALVTTITNKVKEGLDKTPVDFSAEGPAKTALEAAVKLSVENALKDPENRSIKAAIDAAVTERTKDLETEITALKGAKTNSTEGKDEVKPVGSFK